MNKFDTSVFTIEMGSGISQVLNHRVSFDTCQEYFGSAIINRKSFPSSEDDCITVDDLNKFLQSKTDVFLTHDWGVVDGIDNHKRVTEINKLLQDRGITTWFDEEQMEGNIQKKMIRGIDNASCVLVFITKRYMDKVDGDDSADNCQLEFNYSIKRKKAGFILPVVMEKSMKLTDDWCGPIGFHIGNNLYVDMTTDDSVHKNIDDLVLRIKKIIKQSIKERLENLDISKLQLKEPKVDIASAHEIVSIQISDINTNKSTVVNTGLSNIIEIDTIVPDLSNVVIGDIITMSPKQIMEKLFFIQGISVDPTDIKTAGDKIADLVGRGYGDGINQFDCLISYRTSTDRHTAELLYLYLKSLNIYSFLDKYCLPHGIEWYEGFTKGLKSSKFFISLISTAGLSQARDFKIDHSYDNVLLEYETAIKIHESGYPEYIIPLLIGEINNNTYKIFNDYDLNLYDSHVNINQQIVIEDAITMSPKQIIGKLFSIQAIHMDPFDIKTTGNKIAAIVGKGYGDGISCYDCFISYRVATDAHLADKLYLYLKSINFYPFLDKYCLKPGESWKEGLLNGLHTSRVFIPLISKAGLSNACDFQIDHSKDNLLLEYETAIKIHEMRDSCYIYPILVGEITNENDYHRFSDYDLSLYDSNINIK